MTKKVETLNFQASQMAEIVFIVIMIYVKRYSIAYLQYNS